VLLFIISNDITHPFSNWSQIETWHWIGSYNIKKMLCLRIITRDFIILVLLPIVFLHTFCQDHISKSTRILSVPKDTAYFATNRRSWSIHRFGLLLFDFVPKSLNTNHIVFRLFSGRLLKFLKLWRVTESEVSNRHIVRTQEAIGKRLTFNHVGIASRFEPDEPDDTAAVRLVLYYLQWLDA